MRHIRLIIVLTMVLFVAQILALSVDGMAVSKKPRTIIIPMENAEKNWKIFTMVNRLLSLNWEIYRTEESFNDFPGGSFLIPIKDQPISGQRAVKYVEKLSQRYNIPITSYNQQIECQKRKVIQPTIGMPYKGAWRLRAQCVLEQLGFETRIIPYEDIKRKPLRKFNVLVQSGGGSKEMRERLGKEGMEKIKFFIEKGGGYYGACGGACFAYRLNLIPSPMTAEPKSSYNFFPAAFWGPIWVKVKDSSHPIWYGYKEKVILTPWGAHFPQVELDSIKILGEYAEVCPGFHIHHHKINAYEVSKYIPDEWEVLEKVFNHPVNPEYLLGKPAITENNYGKGRVIITSAHPETPGVEQGYSVFANVLFYLAQNEAEGGEQPKINKSIFESLEILEKKIDSCLADIRGIHYSIDDIFHFGLENGFWYIPKDWPKWQYISVGHSFREYQVYSDEFLRHAEYLSGMLKAIGEKEEAILKLEKIYKDDLENMKILDNAQSNIHFFYKSVSTFDQEGQIKELNELLETFNIEYKKLWLYFKELKIAQEEKADKEIIVSIKAKYEEQEKKVMEIIPKGLFDAVADNIANLKFTALEADKWIDYALFCLASKN